MGSDVGDADSPIGETPEDRIDSKLRLTDKHRRCTKETGERLWVMDI